MALPEAVIIGLHETYIVVLRRRVADSSDAIAATRAVPPDESDD